MLRIRTIVIKRNKKNIIDFNGKNLDKKKPICKITP